MTMKHRYTIRCQHTHVSGRRCGNRASKKNLLGQLNKLCGIHNDGQKCSECSAMMQTFVPKSGWGEDGNLL